MEVAKDVRLWKQIAYHQLHWSCRNAFCAHALDLPNIFSMIGHQALFKMGRVYQGAWINIGTTERAKMIHPRRSTMMALRTSTFAAALSPIQSIRTMRPNEPDHRARCTCDKNNSTSGVSSAGLLRTRGFPSPSSLHSFVGQIFYSFCRKGERRLEENAMIPKGHAAEKLRDGIMEQTAEHYPIQTI